MKSNILQKLDEIKDTKNVEEKNALILGLINFVEWTGGFRFIRVSDISAESELDEVLKDFKEKHPLTEIE